MDTNAVLIGKRISAARDRRGWDMSELARRARVSPSYVSRLERGQFPRPSVDKILSIADALGLRVTDLTEPKPVVAMANIQSAVAQIFRADEAPLVAEIVQDLAQRPDFEREQILGVLRMIVKGGSPRAD